MNRILIGTAIVTVATLIGYKSGYPFVGAAVGLFASVAFYLWFQKRDDTEYERNLE